MQIILKRRTVKTEIAVIDTATLPPFLDGRWAVANPADLQMGVAWTDAGSAGDLEAAADGTTIAVRIEDFDTSVALFDRLAVEFQPGHWRIPIRPGHGAVVLPEGRRWVSATQNDGDGNSQVHEHLFHDDIEEAKAHALHLFLRHTQPL